MNESYVISHEGPTNSMHIYNYTQLCHDNKPSRSLSISVQSPMAVVEMVMLTWLPAKKKRQAQPNFLMTRVSRGDKQVGSIGNSSTNES